MSEPSQIYARVHISRARLDAFLASPFPDAGDDPDVLAWLSNASYYGDRYTPELIRERALERANVGAWVDALVAPAPYGFPMPATNRYDDATQTWTLAALDFSENYDDYIAAVAVFREIAKYKDLPGDDGLLIYGYLFANGGVEVALRIEIGASAFLDEAQSGPLVSQADAAMQALVAEGAALGGE